ncbi:MAG: hypothetical protein IKJ13_07730 [Clostridia bacterium]|nr:hypothetical protein [Clostridia bacterium]
MIKVNVKYGVSNSDAGEIREVTVEMSEASARELTEQQHESPMACEGGAIHRLLFAYAELYGYSEAVFLEASSKFEIRNSEVEMRAGE